MQLTAQQAAPQQARSSSCVGVLPAHACARRAPRRPRSVRVAAHQQQHGGAPCLQTDGRQLAQLLVRLAELQVKPHGAWLAGALESVLTPQLASLEPDELAGAVAALAAWAYAPPPAFMAALTAATRAALAGGTLRLSHVAQLAWSLAQLQAPAQPLLDDLVAAAGAMLRDDALHELRANDGADAAGVCPVALADLLWALVKLEHAPGAAWLDAFAAAARPRLHAFTPPQLAQLVWAVARTPHWAPEREWMLDFLNAVQAQLPDFDSKSISLTAWGLATLAATERGAEFRPSTRFLWRFELAAEAVLGDLAAAELACTLWALSSLKSKRAHELRLGRLVRRQTSFRGYDYQVLTNPRLLRLVRTLTLGPAGPPPAGHQAGGGGGSGGA
ncbi:hypothetical protein HT031_000511 [Scenedesmus sp. PABB004]|nr:hypothetical protein HT031_000511 [Scenedesmus sp. PABB004]